MTIRRISSVFDVPREAWDGLDHGGSPFLEHGFLGALERSQSIGAGTGWVPHYLLAEDDGLVGAVAAFAKTDSYGEYIFDWAWARASEQAGLRYYPKLVVAAPFTPATGPRLLVHPDADWTATAETLVGAVRDLAADLEVSSTHWLFVTEREQALLDELGFAPRSSLQFHWESRGYETFEDFLAALKSRKRKQVRKERARAAAAVDDIGFVGGSDIDDELLERMDLYYRRTVAMYGGYAYLEPGFFAALRELSPQRFKVARARKDGETVAGAVFLETEQTLFGRYWGCEQDADCLHFEMAYYQAIERCIERGIPRFEAGAQGEHKLLRGLEPRITRSAHSLVHPGLDRAVRAFVRQEANELEHRITHLAQFGPYRTSAL